MEADNGKQFLENFILMDSSPDICLLDISMPEMNGYDTLKEIKGRHFEQKVIIYTMFNDSYNIIRCLRAGANAFLPKNSHPEEIVKALYTVYEKGSYYADLMTPNLLKTIQNKYIARDLSEKEKQVLKLCCSDLSYDEIAMEMKTTLHSINGYRDKLFEKLGVNSRPMLVVYAISMGIYVLR